MRFKHWFESVEMIPVKSVRQSHNYDCGAAALKAIAKFYDVPLDNERDFIKICDTGKRKGTHPEDIVGAARAMGLRASLYNNLSVDQLKSLLDQRVPVICAIQAYGDPSDYSDEHPKDGHYVIAVGYDDQNIYFEDPSIKGSRGYIPIGEFIVRWHDEESYKDDGNSKQIRMGIVIQGDRIRPDHVDKVKKIE